MLEFIMSFCHIPTFVYMEASYLILLYLSFLICWKEWLLYQHHSIVVKYKTVIRGDGIKTILGPSYGRYMWEYRELSYCPNSCTPRGSCTLCILGACYQFFFVGLYYQLIHLEFRRADQKKYFMMWLSNMQVDDFCSYQMWAIDGFQSRPCSFPLCHLYSVIR